MISSSVLSWSVLRKIAVKNLQFGGIGGIAASAGDLAVLDAAEFVVLQPKIGLQSFRCGREPKECGVTLA